MTDGWPRLVRAGSAWAFASVSVALLSGLLRTIVAARFLEPVEIGVMGIGLLALGFVEAVASTGFDTALVATRKDVEAYIDPAFTVQIARGALIFILLWSLAPAIAGAFHADATNVIRSLAVIAVLRGFANPAVALAVRQLEFRRVFWWSLPEVLCSLMLALPLVAVRGDVWALVIAGVAGQAVGTLASYGLVPRMPRVVLSRHRILDLIRFGRLVGGSRALMFFSVNVDSAVVGLIAGTQALGLYQFATRVAELPVVTFTRAMAQVALPAFSGAQVSAATLAARWRVILGWVVAINGLAAMMIVSLGGAAVDIVVGDRWIEAVPIMRVLALAMVFRAVIVLTGQLLDALGQPAMTMRLNAVRSAMLIVVLPSLAMWGGAQAVAQGMVLAQAATALLAVRMSARALRAVTSDPTEVYRSFSR